MDKKLIWIIACSALSILGGGGRAGATARSNFFQGRIALVACSQEETVDCGDGFTGTIQTNIFVSGDEFLSKTAGQTPDGQNHLGVTSVRFNGCTGDFRAAFGSLADASRQQGLQSASVQGVVPLKDFDDESPAGSMSVNVAFEGFGDVQDDRSRIRFDFPGPDGTTVVIAIRTDGRSRAATASGTLALDGNPVACTFGEGTLMDSKSGDLTIERP